MNSTIYDKINNDLEQTMMEGQFFNKHELKNLTYSELVVLYLKRTGSQYYQMYVEFMEQYEHELFTGNIFNYVTIDDYNMLPNETIMKIYLDIKNGNKIETDNGRKKRVKQ